jgi:hypothetical protein
MKTKWIGGLVVSALGIGVYAGDVVASTPPAPAKATVLGQSRFGEFDINSHTIPANRWHAQLKTHGDSDAWVVDNTFPETGSATTWHTHPGPSLILVLHGTVTNYASDQPNCAGQTYAAGSGFIDEGGDDVHMLRNEGAGPAETIAVQLLPQGAPRKTDMPQPDNCHVTP